MGIGTIAEGLLVLLVGAMTRLLWQTSMTLERVATDLHAHKEEDDRRHEAMPTASGPSKGRSRELRCTRVADAFAMLLTVDGGSELLTLLGRENALRLAEVILDAYQEGDGQ